MHRIKMRLSGTQEDLDKWVMFLRKVESRANLIRILEVSEYYKNRGESVLYRCYAEIELLVDPEN